MWMIRCEKKKILMFLIGHITERYSVVPFGIYDFNHVKHSLCMTSKHEDEKKKKKKIPWFSSKLLIIKPSTVFYGISFEKKKEQTTNT